MASSGISEELDSVAGPSALEVESQRREQVAEIVAFRRRLRGPEEAAYSFPEENPEPERIRWVPIFA